MKLQLFSEWVTKRVFVVGSSVIITVHAPGKYLFFYNYTQSSTNTKC